MIKMLKADQWSPLDTDVDADTRSLALLLALGVYEGLSHYGAGSMEEAWERLNDMERIVVLSENMQFWSPNFDHDMVGLALEAVPGVPEGWMAFLTAVDGRVVGFFVNGPEARTALLDAPDLPGRMAAYKRFLLEPAELTAELWDMAAARKKDAA